MVSRVVPSRAARPLRARRFFCVCLFDLCFMDAALKVGESGLAPLADGVSDKLRDAATAHGDVVVPKNVDGKAVLGQEFRSLAEAAGLDRREMMALHAWLEVAYNAEVSSRFLLDLPTINVSPPSLLMAPVPSAAPPMLAPGLSATTTPPGATTFGRMAGGGFAAAPMGAPMPMPSLTTAASGMAPHLAEDEAAHGMTSGEIALLTWILHIARPPPPGHDAIKYGVDPPAVTKLYKEYGGSGTRLWDLVKDEKTTLRVLQGHFHRAISAAEGSPKIMQRLSDHWMEMQQHFDSVGLMRRYYSRFLVMRAGRGIPKLIDEHIVMLVMLDELERNRGDSSGSGAAEATAIMEKAMSSIESFKTSISDLKSKVSDLKQDVNNLKNEVNTLKKDKKENPKSGDKVCTYCNKTGHTVEFCHKRIADEAVAAAKQADK